MVGTDNGQRMVEAPVRGLRCYQQTMAIGWKKAWSSEYVTYAVRHKSIITSTSNLPLLVAHHNQLPSQRLISASIDLP